MLSRHLIIVVVTFFTVAIIYSSYSTFVIAAKEPSCTISDDGYATCCWDVECEDGSTEENCMNCMRKPDGQWECSSVFTPGLVGTPMCPVKPDSGLTVNPSDDSGIPPEIQELLGSGVSDNPTIQPGDDNTPKDKGLLGLLDETSPTIQQPLPEITTPQKNIPNNDLLSNLDDNLLTNVPTQESSEPLTLLEEGQEEQQQESPIIEDEDKKEEAKEREQKEQLSLNQEDDEIQSREDEQEEKEQEESNEDQEELPPITETLTPE